LSVEGPARCRPFHLGARRRQLKIFFELRETFVTIGYYVAAGQVD